MPRDPITDERRWRASGTQSRTVCRAWHCNRFLRTGHHSLIWPITAPIGRRKNVFVMTPTKAKDDPEQTLFTPGDDIAESGIYCVYHAGHRSSHEVTLLRKERFPLCLKCGHSVSFELVRSIPSLQDRDFQVRLYAIPHPSEAV